MPSNALLNSPPNPTPPSRARSNMQGCFTCRIRKKKCDAPFHSVDKSFVMHSCRNCQDLRVECLLGYGECIPERFRHPAIKELIKRWNKTPHLRSHHLQSLREAADFIDRQASGWEDGPSMDEFFSIFANIPKTFSSYLDPAIMPLEEAESGVRFSMTSEPIVQGSADWNPAMSAACMNAAVPPPYAARGRVEGTTGGESSYPPSRDATSSRGAAAEDEAWCYPHPPYPFTANRAHDRPPWSEPASRFAYDDSLPFVEAHFRLGGLEYDDDPDRSPLWLAVSSTQSTHANLAQGQGISSFRPDALRTLQGAVYGESLILTPNLATPPSNHHEYSSAEYHGSPPNFGWFH